MNRTECDKLVSRVNSGDRDAIILALESDIPFAAFRAIIMAGDLRLSDDSIVEGVQLWREAEIEMLGRPMKEYARAVLYSFGKIDTSDISEAEKRIAAIF